MTLSKQQRKFSRLVARLLDQVYAQGFECTLGEAWRTPEQAALNEAKGRGISTSLHMDRLAIDLNLFKDGVFLQTTEDHKPIGEWWEKLDTECRWGGRFKRPDGNHYSLAWGGRA